MQSGCHRGEPHAALRRNRQSPADASGADDGRPPPAPRQRSSVFVNNLALMLIR